MVSTTTPPAFDFESMPSWVPESPAPLDGGRKKLPCDMSLEGPRLQVAKEEALDDNAGAGRLFVKPGMLGLWQVSGRSNLELDESVRLDLHYVENWSMTADIAILARTVRAVLASNGTV